MPSIRIVTQVAGAGMMAIGLAGCEGTPPQLNIEADWRRSIGQLGMFAVYPVAEDVQIGDIFLYAPADGDGADARFDLTRIAPLPLEKLVQGLKDEQGGRLVFQRSPAKPAPEDKEAAKAKEKQQGQQQGRGATPRPTPTPFHVGHAENDAAVVRMRRVALPGFTAARITQAQLGGGGSSGNVGFSAALGGSSSVAVSVTLNDVEELSIDASRALEIEWTMAGEMLRRHLRPEKLFDYVRNARSDLVLPMCRADFKRLAEAKLGFVVANRVMYAHVIEYNFHDSSTFSAELKAAILAKATETPKKDDEKKDEAKKDDGKKEEGKKEAPKLEGLAAKLAALEAALAAQGAGLGGLVPGTPGISAKLGVGRLGTAAMTVDYARPLAVGIGAPRTLTLEELLRFAGSIASGAPPAPDVDSNDVNTLDYNRLKQEYASLRYPMRQSFKNLVEVCRNALTAAGGRAEDVQPLANLAVADNVTDPAQGPAQTGGAGAVRQGTARAAPRISSGPSVRALVTGR